MAIKRTHYQIAGSLLGRLIDTHNFIRTKIFNVFERIPISWASWAQAPHLPSQQLTRQSPPAQSIQ